ncbi:ABC transporter substrate-binding protein [Candidatus Woesearchaeota archaeon]|nr:ABC transporter substrate-binding protein [Candidatus Woesearchaeota archaeon]
MTNKKQIYIGIAAVILIAAISLYSFPKGEGTIKIGWIGPQTGQSAVLGIDSFVAAQIAVDEINANGGIDGKQIQLIIEDDQYDTGKSVTAYNKLVNVDGSKFILANTYGSVFALADGAKNDDVILIDPLDCNSELAGLNDNVFCLATDSKSIAEALAENAEKSGFDKVGVLYWNSDLFMPLVQKEFKENYNGEIALSEAYSAGTKDFKTQLAKMIDKDVQAILLLGYDETGIAMKQARILGFEGQFYTTGTVTSPSLQGAAAGCAEGTIFAYWEASKNQEPSKTFTTKFIEEQGRPAILDLASYPTYDAVLVLAEAIDNADSLNVEKVKEELFKIQGVSGVTGTINMASDGSMRIKESAYVLADGLPIKIE